MVSRDAIVINAMAVESEQVYSWGGADQCAHKAYAKKF